MVGGLFIWLMVGMVYGLFNFNYSL